MKKVLATILIAIMLTGCNDKKTSNYVVTFDTKGGSAIGNQVIETGDAVLKPEDPVKDGYLFVRWVYDEDTYDFSKIIDKNVNLIAEWRKINDGEELYTVKYDSKGGTTLANTIVSEGVEITKPDDPVREGYTFLEWKVGNETYLFDNNVFNNITLTAVWVKNEDIVINNKQIETPVISFEPLGGEEKDGTLSTAFSIKNFQGVVEIYYSTAKDGSYKILRKVTKPDESKNLVYVKIPFGSHYYYKVRCLIDDKYTEYSNIIDYDNSFDKPSITLEPLGNIDTNGTMNTYLKVNKIQGNLEIYYATNLNGNYKLLSKSNEPDETGNLFSISIPLGSHYYFKARYESNGKFSAYSNVIEYNNQLEKPYITLEPLGNVGPNGTLNTYIKLNKIQGEVEIYHSTSKDGSYKLLRKSKTADEKGNLFNVSVPLGNKYYYKVRFVSNNGYGEYSNIVECDNSFTTPTISILPMGQILDDGTENVYFKVNNWEGDLEIYYALSQNESYKIMKVEDGNTNEDDTFSVTIPKGKKYYIKVRCEVNGAYSDYSNVVDYDNRYEVPVIKALDLGHVDEEGTLITTFLLEKVYGDIEIYYSTNKLSDFKFVRKASQPDAEKNQYQIEIPQGKQYYFKVRYTSNGAYSEYSNVISVSN